MTKQRPKTMKHKRSRTATAMSQLFFGCFLLALASSSLIEANRRSSELMLCSAAAAWAAGDDEEDGVRSSSSTGMTSFGLVTRSHLARRPQRTERTLTQRQTVGYISYSLFIIRIVHDVQKYSIKRNKNVIQNTQSVSTVTQFKIVWRSSRGMTNPLLKLRYPSRRQINSLASSTYIRSFSVTVTVNSLSSPTKTLLFKKIIRW